MELEVGGLTAGYGSQPVIFDVHALIRPRSIVAIIGPNGAGKSTMFKAIFGVARIFEGTIKLDGVPISKVVPQTLVQAGVAFVPQIGNVFPSLSVAENLEIGTYVRTGGSKDYVLSIFPDLGPIMGRPAGKLSGGQRNMLAVGRALMSRPEVLLLDEATAGLAPVLAGTLWQHLAQLAKDGLAIGVVEQNVRLALQFSHQVYLLASGRNRLEGPAAEFAERGDLEQVFLEAGATPEQQVTVD